MENAAVTPGKEGKDETAHPKDETARPERSEKADVRIRQLLRERRERDDRIAALEKENADLRAAAERQASAEQQERNDAQAAFDRGLQQSRGRHKDFDEALKLAVPVPREVRDALVALGELGAETSYYLAKNPRLCRELCSLLPRVAIHRVTRLAFDIEREIEIQAQCNAAARWYQNVTAPQSSTARKGA